MCDGERTDVFVGQVVAYSEEYGTPLSGGDVRRWLDFYRTLRYAAPIAHLVDADRAVLGRMVDDVRRWIQVVSE